MSQEQNDFSQQRKNPRPIGTALVELFASHPVELDIKRAEIPRPPPSFGSSRWDLIRRWFIRK
jgi:hypothetical protein